jgi:hypothetical protein
VNSKINLFLGSIAIAAKKLYGYPVERRTVAHARNIMNIMLVHDHDLVPTTMNEMKTFRCNTCGTIYCQLCGKSLIPRATQNHKIVCMTK